MLSWRKCRYFRSNARTSNSSPFRLADNAVYTPTFSADIWGAAHRAQAAVAANEAEKSAAETVAAAKIEGLRAEVSDAGKALVQAQARVRELEAADTKLREKVESLSTPLHPVPARQPGLGFRRL